MSSGFRFGKMLRKTRWQSGGYMGYAMSYGLVTRDSSVIRHAHSVSASVRLTVESRENIRFKKTAPSWCGFLYENAYAWPIDRIDSFVCTECVHERDQTHLWADICGLLRHVIAFVMPGSGVGDPFRDHTFGDGLGRLCPVFPPPVHYIACMVTFSQYTEQAAMLCVTDEGRCNRDIERDRIHGSVMASHAFDMRR